MVIIQTLTVVILLVATGIADSWGFIHAGRVWASGKFSIKEMSLAYMSYFVGIFVYVLLLFYLRKAGIKSTELQTAIWFLVTMGSVSLIDGNFWKWPYLDKIVMVFVVIGLLWLVVRVR